MASWIISNDEFIIRAMGSQVIFGLPEKPTGDVSIVITVGNPKVLPERYVDTSDIRAQITEIAKYTLPRVSSANAGQILRVSASGEWEVVDATALS